MHFKQQLISSLLFGFVLAAKEWNDMTEDEKYNASVTLWVCIIIGVLISVSASAAGGFFFMMRKRRNNMGGATVVSPGGAGGGVVMVG